jgi:hypothetical protein
MSNRYEDWDRAEEHYRQVVDLTRKARKGDRTTDTTKREMPFERSIVIPASKAIHEVRKTQLCSLFLHRDPPLNVVGRGPEDIRPAKIMETVLAYDCQQMNFPLSVYMLIQNADKYGLGILYDVWEQEQGMKPAPPGMMQTLGSMFGMQSTPPMEWGTVKEYNRWHPVDPYLFWPDPRVSISNLQEAEFIGHRIYRGQTYLYERKPEPGNEKGSAYFNIEEAIKRGRGLGSGESSSLLTRSRFGIDDFTLTDSPDDKDKGFFALDTLQVKIIPKDWELGSSTRPEIWWFTLANEAVIIRAHPNPYDHRKFTYSVAEVNPDTDTIFNQGTFEDLDGLQRTINWLWNSRIENVRKMLNDSLVIAPSMVEMGDVLNPRPARHIRLSQAGEERVIAGADPLNFLRQLVVQDFTSAHSEIAMALFDFMQRLAGSNDTSMGAPTQEKKTLGEIQSLMASSSQRLAMLARVIDSTCLAQLASRAVQNRQQFTSMEMYVRIAGDAAKMEELMGEGATPDQQSAAALGRLLVSKSDLIGQFDYIPQTGVIPADPARQAELWIRMLDTASQNPLLQQPGADGRMIDFRKVFDEAIRQSGIRNVEDFYQMVQQPPMAPPDAMAGAAPPQVVPDEQFRQQVQAGNYVDPSQLPPQ